MKNLISKNKIAVTALTVSLLMIFMGIVTGQTESVMAKAVKICLECVGIG